MVGQTCLSFVAIPRVSVRLYLVVLATVDRGVSHALTSVDFERSDDEMLVGQLARPHRFPIRQKVK